MGNARTGRRWLVTGGSGFLGVNLVRHLLARGESVRTLDLVPFDAPERDRIDARVGDVCDRTAVRAALDGVEVVVHAAAALPREPRERILRTGVQGTGTLLDETLRAGVGRFVFISSTAVYGVPKHCPIDENAPLTGLGPYGEAKIAAEELCRVAGSTGRVVTTVLRPKTFVGPERLGIFSLLFAWAHEGHGFPALGGGDNRYQLLDVADLCEAITTVVAAPAGAANDTFNVGADEFGTVREDYQAVLDAAGHGARVRRLPAGPAVRVLRMLDRVGLSPVYPWVYETAGKDSFVAIDRLRERVGFAPRYSNREALLRSFEWYRANVHAIPKADGAHHRTQWDPGVLGLVRHLF